MRTKPWLAWGLVVCVELACRGDTQSVATAESSSDAGTGSTSTGGDTGGRDTATTGSGSGPTGTGSSGPATGDETGITAGSDSTGITAGSDGTGVTAGSDSTGSTAGTGATMCVDVELGSVIPVSVAGNNEGGPDNLVPSCGYDGGNTSEVVYRFTAPQDGTYVIDTFGSEADTIVTVLDGCDGVELACNDDVGTARASELVIDLVADQQVIIGVDGWNLPGLGPHMLNVDLFPDQPANPYGDCVDSNEGCEEAGESCLVFHQDIGVAVGMCGWSHCEQDGDCPQPTDGTATPICWDFDGDSDHVCVLECGPGVTCPLGMICDEDVIPYCVYELDLPPPPEPQDGGNCCEADSEQPGCDVAEIEACVCGTYVYDPFCCYAQWDGPCAFEASAYCNAICEDLPGTTGV